MVEVVRGLVVGFVVGVAGGVGFGGDFADFVVEYRPAPGEFINGASFGDASAAVGAPVGGGVFAPDSSKLVSLGGFGGSVTLGFLETVEDDALNPMGLDAIVFGNAFWAGGDAARRFTEAGIIEISRDANGNGVADDAWYLIPGADIDAAVAFAAFEVQAWDDDPGTVLPPAEVSFYPDAGLFPELQGGYETGTFALPRVYDDSVLVNDPPADMPTLERYRGYADMTPTMVLGDVDGDGVVDAPSLNAGSFYTVPDNPFVIGVSAGSGGGDGFDIAWAIDAATGEPARLDGFDFIRISTAGGVFGGLFGERSTEVGGVSDVRAGAEADFDIDGDGRATVEDMYVFSGRAASGDPDADLNGDLAVDGADYELLERAVRRDELRDMTAGRR